MRSALLFFTPPTPRADDEFMSEPRQGDQLGAWLNPRGTAGGWTLEGGDILQDHAVFRDLEPTTGARVTLELHHRDAVPLLRACKATGVALVYLPRGYSVAQVARAIGEQLGGGRAGVAR